MTSDRLLCVVIGCSHTIARRRLADPSHNEWICPQHWKAVSAHTKRHRRRLGRLVGKAARTGRPAIQAILEARQAALWEKTKAEAIEAAVGIG